MYRYEEFPWEENDTAGSIPNALLETSPPRIQWTSRDPHHETLPAVSLDGVVIHAITEAGVVEHILSEIEAGHGGVVVTPNLDHLRRCETDIGFRALVAEADLVVPDGMPLVWASRIQGTPLPERVAGSDLISSLSAAAATRKHSIFLLGGDPGTAEAAAQVLLFRHPHLKIAGTLCPPFGFDKDEDEIRKIVSTLHAAHPDIVFVALGSPKQEMLIERIRARHPGTWWLGIGNSFSFLSGHVRRAPVWMQRHGLEWIHRLLQEPKRLFKRYIVFGIPFAAKLFSRAAIKGLPAKFNRPVLESGGIISQSSRKESIASLTPNPLLSDFIAPRLAERALVQFDRSPLCRLRSVVLLAGAVRPMPLTVKTGRSILDLPLDGGSSILQQWISHTSALAGLAELASIPIRVMVNRHSPDPLGAIAAAETVRIERDFGEYRGTGGVLRDLASEYDDDDLILVANGGQILLEPLADIAHLLSELSDNAALVAHQDGTPGGIMLVRCRALRLISEAGFVDMKEQALPQIALRYSVGVLQRRRPTGLPVRSLSDYIFALRTFYRQRAQIPFSDPLAENWRPTFSIIEQGAVVDPSARLHDAVALRGARLDGGAVAVRSIICPAGIVRRDHAAVDRFVNASEGRAR